MRLNYYWVSYGDMFSCLGIPTYMVQNINTVSFMAKDWIVTHKLKRCINTRMTCGVELIHVKRCINTRMTRGVELIHVER